MTVQQTPALQLPSFIQGTYRSVQQKARREGLRCGAQYRENGSFPLPRRMLELSPGEVIVAHEVVDFQRELPAWRLYMVSNVMGELSDLKQKQSPFPVRTDYEKIFRETAWGALFFVTTHMAPASAERTAQRLQAVLRFWDVLQSARYLFKKLGAAQTLEDFMVASCGWVMEAWCPTEEISVHERLEQSAQRMARATREECIDVILQRIPRALAHAGELKHRSIVADPMAQRERFVNLQPRFFERISGAHIGDLIGQLHDWDYELEKH